MTEAANTREDVQQEHIEEIPEEEAIERIAAARGKILEQVRKRIYGQTELIELLLTALFARGHCLLMGVPGLAKTSLIATLAEVLSQMPEGAGIDWRAALDPAAHVGEAPALARRFASLARRAG